MVLEAMLFALPVCCSVVSEPRSHWLKTLVLKVLLLQGFGLIKMVLEGCSFMLLLYLIQLFPSEWGW